MPELPEVEVVRRGLAARGWSAAPSSRVEVLHPRAVRRHAAGRADFAAAAGRAAGRWRRARRGKYLWLPLDDRRRRCWSRTSG